MTLGILKQICKQIKGIERVRASKFGDGIFLYYKETFSEYTGRWFKFTDFIPLDSWKASLERTRMEYGRFFK